MASDNGNTLPVDRRIQLANLLDRYAEYELIRLHGRSFHLPQQARVHSVDPCTGGVHVTASGVCFIPATAAPTHRIVDEFGFAFRSLGTVDQALIVFDNFGGLEFVDSLRIFRINHHEIVDIARKDFFGIIQKGKGIVSLTNKAWSLLDQAWKLRQHEFHD